MGTQEKSVTVDSSYESPSASSPYNVSLVCDYHDRDSVREPLYIPETSNYTELSLGRESFILKLAFMTTPQKIQEKIHTWVSWSLHFTQERRKLCSFPIILYTKICSDYQIFSFFIFKSKCNVQISFLN